MNFLPHIHASHLCCAAAAAAAAAVTVCVCFFLHGNDHIPVRQPCAGRYRRRSVLAAGRGFSMTVPPCTHLYAVPALCLQLDIWYSEERRHCKEEEENKKIIKVIIYFLN